jgi:hypothetical protein
MKTPDTPKPQPKPPKPEPVDPNKPPRKLVKCFMNPEGL